MAPTLLRIWTRPPVALFVFGLVLRLLFARVDDPIGTCWHVGFAGDGPVWSDFAPRLAGDLPLDGELMLPWRPPGMSWLIAWTWGANGPLPLRILMVLCGAAVGPLAWWLLCPHVTATVAWLAAALCSAASSMLLASSGVQIEGPYVPMVLLALCVHDRLRAPHRPWVPLVFGVLHALICLWRAEHLVYFAGWLVLLAATRVRVSSLVVAVLAFAATLLPWQVTASRMVDEFNRSGPPLPERRLQWDAEASTTVGRLPVFAQAHVVRLVDETVFHRGGRRVTAADLAIVTEAYGYWPEPVPVPLIALYGGLSFFVANAPEGMDGLWRATDRPLPLVGGAARYPAWVAGRPGEHRRFSPAFPPHLEIALHGFRLGMREILADPIAFCGRVGRKFWYALGGAVPGIGGYALPIGLSGERRPVDMVAAVGWWPSTYRIGVLSVAIAGLYGLRRQRGLWPLFLFGAMKMVVIAAYFGQARHGVLLVPLTALGVAAVVAPRLVKARLIAPWRGFLLLLALVAVDAVRAGITTAKITYDESGGPAMESWDFLPARVEFR